MRCKFSIKYLTVYYVAKKQVVGLRFFSHYLTDHILELLF